MSELIPVTSWSRNRRHYAREESMRTDPDGGRYGVPLCYSRIKTTVYDQDWLDAMRLKWFGKAPGSQLIESLRPCQQCNKVAARLRVEEDVKRCPDCGEPVDASDEVRHKRVHTGPGEVRVRASGADT